MLSFLYVYSDHSILECYNLFSGVELSMRSFFVIYINLLYYFEGCFITYFDLKNHSKLSAFTTITAQIKLRDSHHVANFAIHVYSGVAMPRMIVYLRKDHSSCSMCTLTLRCKIKLHLLRVIMPTIFLMYTSVTVFYKRHSC